MGFSLLLWVLNQDNWKKQYLKINDEYYQPCFYLQPNPFLFSFLS